MCNELLSNNGYMKILTNPKSYTTYFTNISFSVVSSLMVAFGFVENTQCKFLLNGLKVFGNACYA